MPLCGRNGSGACYDAWECQDDDDDGDEKQTETTMTKMTMMENENVSKMDLCFEFDAGLLCARYRGGQVMADCAQFQEGAIE